MRKVKPIKIEGEKYFTENQKNTLLPKWVFVKLCDTMLYSRKEKKFTKLYPYLEVKRLYEKYNKQRNVYIPCNMKNENHFLLLKDYVIYGYKQSELAKKYGVSKQRVFQIIDKYQDPLKEKYENIIVE